MLASVYTSHLRYDQSAAGAFWCCTLTTLSTQRKVVKTTASSTLPSVEGKGLAGKNSTKETVLVREGVLRLIEVTELFKRLVKLDLSSLD